MSAEFTHPRTGIEKKLEVVVFDLGGVLIDWNPRYVYRELFEGDDERVEWFLAEICSPSWNEQQDAGRTFEEGVRLLVERHPEHETMIRAYADRWEDMLGGPIQGTVEILEELRRRDVPLFALTNWSAETFPRARQLYHFLEWFDAIVVSGEIRMIKPHPEIFHHLTNTHGITAANSVFIDDNAANVETACSLGFHGIRFESPEQLRGELEELGIL